MIQCKNISKTYDKYPIFKNFSYHFEQTGFYALYGPSGSGKTTLFNILLGITPFEGTIIYGDREYKNKINFDDVQEKIAYISQDNYFIDYLTMEENLLLESNKDSKEILKIVKLLNLASLISKYPYQLSGGERQRFAIAGNLLKDKKIFFFDEPTSSLDKDNKIKIFEILKKLKESVLVICATHDEIVFEYADNVIDFNNLDSYKIEKENKTSFEVSSDRKFSYSSCVKLFKSFCKQIKRNSKKISLVYIVIFSLALLLCYACTDYENKLFTSLVNRYDMNALRIDCSIDTKDYCENLLSNYKTSETVYHYLRNIPEDNVGIDGSASSFDFSLDILSLPTKKEDLIGIEDTLMYGTYFTNKNQIILGHDVAIKLAQNRNIDLSKLIGREEEIKLPDGIDTFEIVGILKPMDNQTNFYFKSILGQYDFDTYYYLSGEYLEKYKWDDVLGGQEQNSSTRATSLTVFFKDKYNFLKFYNDYKDKTLNDADIRVQNPTDYFLEYGSMTFYIQTISFYLSITFLVLAMIFYFQIHKTQNTYTEHYYCVYQYYGYKHKEIKYASIMYFVAYILFLLCVSFVSSSIVAFIINSIITNLNIFPFPLFEIEGKWILSLAIILSLIAVVEGLYLNYSRKKDGWYQMLKEKSDLL